MTGAAGLGLVGYSLFSVVTDRNKAMDTSGSTLLCYAKLAAARLSPLG